MLVVGSMGYNSRYQNASIHLASRINYIPGGLATGLRMRIRIGTHLDLIRLLMDVCIEFYLPPWLGVQFKPTNFDPSYPYVLPMQFILLVLNRELADSFMVL